MWRRIQKRFHPQGIPWPATLLYNAISRSNVFQRHYELVAQDVIRQGPVERILDIGTGPARLLLALGELLPNAELFGVDISAAMVATAERNLSRVCHHGKVELKVSSAESLPFPDDSFDCVISTGSLHHWKEPVTALNEVHRVLKDGRRALIYDLVREMPASIAQEVKREFGPFRLALLWLHSFEEPFLNIEEMLSLAEKTLFRGAQVRFAGALCCVDLKKQKSPQNML